MKKTWRRERTPGSNRCDSGKQMVEKGGIKKRDLDRLHHIRQKVKETGRKEEG